MDAKELYDHYKDRCARSPREMEDDEFALVIRALSLLAAVEDGEGIVRNLDTLRDFLDMAGQDTYSEIATQATARITLDAQEKAALKAELASVKAQRDKAWKVIEAGVHLDDAVRRATAAHPKE